MMNKQYLIGADIGASKISLGVFNRELKLVGEIYKFPFHFGTSAFDEFKMNILNPIEQLLKKNGLSPEQIICAGIDMPALVDKNTGKIIIWPNNKLWNDFPIIEQLSNNLEFPFVIEEDANAAAYGEFCKTQDQNINNLVFISIGTGIGCGIILNREIYRGENGWAGEIGHVNLSSGGEICKCGLKGCLQTILSGNYIETYTDINKTAQHQFPITLSKLLDLMEDGDQSAKTIVMNFVNELSRIISLLVMILDIEYVVIGGGIAQAGDKFLNLTKSKMKNYLSLDRISRVNIKLAKEINNSGLYGSVYLADKFCKK